MRTLAAIACATALFAGPAMASATLGSGVEAPVAGPFSEVEAGLVTAITGEPGPVADEGEKILLARGRGRGRGRARAHGGGGRGGFSRGQARHEARERRGYARHEIHEERREDRRRAAVIGAGVALGTAAAIDAAEDDDLDYVCPDANLDGFCDTVIYDVD